MNRLFGAKKEEPKPEPPKPEPKKEEPEEPKQPRPSLGDQQARVIFKI